MRSDTTESTNPGLNIVAPECSCEIGSTCQREACCYFGGLVPANAQKPLIAPDFYPSVSDRMAWFFSQAWDVFIDGGEIDGDALQDLIKKSGLANWQPATAEQVEKFHGDIEEGDPMLVLTPEAHAKIRAVRQYHAAIVDPTA